jgi:hypothetical protein
MSSHEPTDHTEATHSPLDQWHQHPAELGVPQTEHAAHANIPVLLVAFTVITVSTVVFSVIIGMYAINQISLKREAGEDIGLRALAPEVVQYKEDALAAQQGYGWTAEGNVRLPIEQAMDMIVADYGGQPNQ